MKISKVFGVVLGLHFGVITVLIVQPGCSTKQPPTKVYTQTATYSSGDSGASNTSTSGVIDSAFNANIEETRFEPQRPTETVVEEVLVEEVDVPALTPIVVEQPAVVVTTEGYMTYVVQKGDSLWGISKQQGVSLQDLYSANGLNKKSVLRVGQEIKIPTDASVATVTTKAADVYQPSGYAVETTTYKVQSGDTLSQIANKFGTTVRELKATNGKNSDIIQIGEELIVPGAASTAMGATSSQPAPSVVSPVSSGATHTVQSGEYPGAIAQKYGMSVKELLQLNGISDPRKLQVGQVLKLSPAAASPVVNTAPVQPKPVEPAVTIIESKPVEFEVPTEAKVEDESVIEIRMLDSEPAEEGAFNDPVDTDAMFESAVEIPVIRVE